MAQLSRIFIYPIKSCRGVAVSSAQVEPRGLERDRRYMLVDANGRFLTQRRHARMALIEVAMDGDGYLVGAPERDPLHLPFSLDAADPGGGTCEVKIWQERVEATLAPADVNIWFSEYLGFACGLVYMADDQHRPVHHETAAFDDEVGFADGAPLLLVSEPSLGELNRRLDREVDMRRFRPNLVVTADEPHAEDGWNSVTIGAARFDVAWPCSRCILTTIDPATGERDPAGEPMTTLGSYRREGRSVYFGQNLLPRALGRVAVGDVLDIEAETEKA